jgi:hypothetical protein
MNNNIPLPQDTKLYQVSNGAIVNPRLSVETLKDTCTYSSYSNLQNNLYIFEIYSQNVDELYLKFDDKAVSSIAGTNSYYDLDGFDYSFDFRFLNLSSPTICFLPQIRATDTGVNVGSINGPGLSSIISLSNLSYTGLSTNDYVLLTNQTATSQNVVYRVTAVSSSTVTVYNDPLINTVLDQNPNYIFTRAQVSNANGVFYYGLLNSQITQNYQWVSQTKGLKLATADYGITLSAELTSNNIPINTFSVNGVSPLIGQIIAINVLPTTTGGKTSGVYKITNITNNLAYIAPIYPQYLFIQQFVKVSNDFSTKQPAIWIVNPNFLGANNYYYSAQPFAFSTYRVTSIQSNPSLWARQVGTYNDTVLGFSLFTNYNNNNYLQASDIFSVCESIPQWVANGASINGLNLNLSYSTNLINVLEEVSVL